MMIPKRAIAAVVMAVGAAMSCSVLRAAAEGGPSATLENRYRMETVAVTAQQRVEDLQDVPISVQSFPARTLAAEGIDTIEQLGHLAPALQFTMVAGFPLVFIRGVGTDNFVPSADSSVATYIDGIYTPVGIAGLTSLAGIDRVEVLKGPQGTLFGRDATAGAISLVTAEPGGRLHASVDGELGSDADRIARVVLFGPVTDWLSVGVSGVYSHLDSEYLDTAFSPAADVLKAGRLKLFLHTGDWSLSMTAYRGLRSGTDAMIAKNTHPSLLGTLAGIKAQPDDYSAHNDHASGARTTQSMLYGTLRWNGPWFDFKLLGSGQRFGTPFSSTDFDASPVPLAALTTTNTFSHLQTAELQVLSNSDSWHADVLNWAAGVYYLQSRAGIDPGIIQFASGLLGAVQSVAAQSPLGDAAGDLQTLFDEVGLSNTPLGDNGLSIAFSGVLGTRSLSAYSQATFHLTDWLEATLGGRVQHEDRFLVKSETDLAAFNGRNPLPLMRTALPSANADNFSPHAVLSVRPVESVLLYGSYSVAYKSGTFNLVNILHQPSYIEPERAEAFELGFKYQTAAHDFRVDAAVFDSRIKHLQSGFVSLFSGGLVDFVTVPRARSRGAEVATTWEPFLSRNPLVLVLNAAYVDARYTDFPSGPGFQKGTGLYSGTRDLTGDRMVYTPVVSGTVGATQLLQVGRGQFEATVSDQFNSGFYTDAYNTNREPGFAVLGFHTGYRDDLSHVSATFFCNNALDRRYHLVNVQTDFGTVKSLALPREIGVRLAYSW